MTRTFIQYHKNYKLGRTKDYDPRYQFAILGEVGDEYIIFDYSTGTFSSNLKSRTLIVDNSNDVNFRLGWCINIKNVDHHVGGFQKEINSVAIDASFNY